MSTTQWGTANGHNPKVIMNIISRPIALLKDSFRPYLILNAVTFGVFVGGMIVGTIWPDISRNAGTAMGSLAGMSPASGGALSSLDQGQVWMLALIIFGANIASAGLLMAILPSLVIPFAGIAIHVVFAGFLGLTYAPSSFSWALLLPHLPTLIIELASYVFFMLGVYRFGIAFLFTRPKSLNSRGANYRRGLAEMGWLSIPAVALLAIGAIYEAFEVIAILK